MKTRIFEFDYKLYKETIKKIDKLEKELPFLKGFDTYVLGNCLKAHEEGDKIVFTINYKEFYFGSKIFSLYDWVDDIILMLNKIRRKNFKSLKHGVDIEYDVKKDKFISDTPHLPDSFYVIKPFIKYLQIDFFLAYLSIEIEGIKINIEVYYDVPSTKITIYIPKKILKEEENEKEGENNTDDSKNSKT